MSLTALNKITVHPKIFLTSIEKLNQRTIRISDLVLNSKKIKASSMKNKVSALLFICLALPLAAFNPASKGIHYNSSEARFSISFPADYTVDSDNSADIKTVKVMSTYNDQTFLVSYTIHTADVSDTEYLCEVSLNSFRESIAAEISEDLEWKLKKNKGLKAIMNIEEMDAQVEYYVIFSGQIQYQLAVVASYSLWDQKSADAFIKSFKLEK